MKLSSLLASYTVMPHDESMKCIVRDIKLRCFLSSAWNWQEKIVKENKRNGFFFRDLIHACWCLEVTNLKRNSQAENNFNEAC